MLLQAFLICLLANVLQADPGSNVAVGIVRPRSISLEAHNEKIRNFWTDERLKGAIPMDITLPNLSSRTTFPTSNVSNGPASSVSGSLPSENGIKSRAISATGRQVSTTGRVFWTVGDYQYSCSAAVVTSTTGDVVATAGHCVYDTTEKTWYNNNNWVFVPAYSNNYRPYGTWPARQFLIKQAWVSSADYNYDVAFVALSTLNDQHVQSVVGSQGIGFNQPRLAYIYSFGYPANLGNGEYLKSCVGYTQASKYTQNGYVGQGLPCTMGHGCSGGPWLQNVVASTGIGYVTSVNSFSITTVPNVINGPYFDSNVKSLYDQAKLI